MMHQGTLAVVTLTVVGLGGWGMRLTAQTPLPPAAPVAVLTTAEIKKALEVNPGHDTSLKSIDAGKHVVDLWLEQRRAGAGGTPMAHSELTEIYFVVSGTATLVAGGKLLDPTYNAKLPTQIMPGGAKFPTPTYSGKDEGGTTYQIGPGDVVVLPPGSQHHWESIGPQGLIYLIARVDPEHKMTAGFVNPLLSK